jgi:hypothetical protein
MISLSMRTNFPAIARKMDQLPDDIANKAMSRSLNKTVEQGKNAMARTISAEFRVSVGAAKSRLKVERAKFKGQLRLTAVLQATRPAFNGEARGMNMIHFIVGGQPKRTKNGKMRQLSFQIKRGGGRKQIPGAFIATNKRTGGTAVFVREGNERMPIVTKTTIDFPQMFNTKRINEVVRDVMQRNFSSNFDRELKVILQGFVK